MGLRAWWRRERAWDVVATNHRRYHWYADDECPICIRHLQWEAVRRLEKELDLVRLAWEFQRDRDRVAEAYRVLRDS